MPRPSTTSASAIELAPDRPEAYEERAALYGSGDLEAAHADLTELLKIDPENVWAYRARAHVFVAQGEFRDALEDLNVALRLTPGDAIVHASRGWAYAYFDQFQNAADDFSQALKLDAESMDALAGRAFLTLRWKAQPDRNLEQAYQDLLRACESYQWQHPDYIEILAAVCQERGDSTQAEEYRQKAESLAGPRAKESQKSELPNNSDGASRARVPLVVCC